MSKKKWELRLFLKEEDLRSASYNFLSDHPTGRADAINLKMWLLSKLQQIQKNTAADTNTRLNQADEILFLALNECIRQVSYGCLERGQLIMALFRSYQILMKKQQRQINSEKQSLRILNYASELEQEQNFLQAQGERDRAIEEKTRELEQLAKELGALKEDFEQMVQNERKSRQKIEQGKLVQKQAANVLVRLQKENTDLRSKIVKMKIFGGVKGGGVIGSAGGNGVVGGRNMEQESQQVKNEQAKQKQQQQQQHQQQQQQQSFQGEEDEAEEENDKSLSRILRDAAIKTYVEVNQDIIVKDIVEEPPKIMYSKETQCAEEVKKVHEQGCQTELEKLVSSEFDRLLSNQELDNCIKELQLKDQINQFTDMHFGEEEKPTINVIKPKEEKVNSDNKLNLIRILNGLPGEISQIKNMEKLEMFDQFQRNLNIMRDILEKEQQQQQKSEEESDSSYFTNEEGKVEESSNRKREASKNQASASIEDSQHVLTQRTIPQQRELQATHQQHSSQLLSTREQPSPGVNWQKPSKLLRASSQKAMTFHFQNKQKPNISSKDLEGKIQEQEEGFENSPQQSMSKVSRAPSLKNNSILEKAALTKQTQKNLKAQLTMFIMIYNIQVQKNQNLTKSINDLIELLKSIFNFCRKMLIHLIKTQKQTHRQILEEFQAEFEMIRKRLPFEIDNDIKEEDVFDEDDTSQLEKKKQLEKQKHAIRKTRRITKALEFNFQQRLNKPTMFDKLMHPGLILAIKVRDQYSLLKKAVNFLPLKNVLRIITQIYEEKIRMIKDNQVAKDIEMQIFVFTFFLNRFGFKTVAEKKYLQFLLSVMHFSQIFRVNVFARIQNILPEEGLNFNSDETAVYLQAMEFMNSESTLGISIVHNESEAKYFVPYVRALDFMKYHLENKMSEEELREIRVYLEQIKETDVKNKAGVVDIDQFLVCVISKYRVMTTRTKKFVIHAFQAADLDGNKKINHNEFVTLFRHIEARKFEFRAALDLFEEAADIITKEEKNLSFDKFTALCVNQQLFSEESQNTFLGIKNGEQVREKFETTRASWDEYKKEVLHILLDLKPYVSHDIHHEWDGILQTLEKRMKSQLLADEVKPVLIAHKILKQELLRLVEIGQQEDEDDGQADEQQDTAKKMSTTSG